MNSFNSDAVGPCQQPAPDHRRSKAEPQNLHVLVSELVVCTERTSKVGGKTKPPDTASRKNVQGRTLFAYDQYEDKRLR